jgi:hypothetical protein
MRLPGKLQLPKGGDTKFHVSVFELGKVSTFVVELRAHGGDIISTRARNSDHKTTFSLPKIKIYCAASEAFET